MQETFLFNLVEDSISELTETFFSTPYLFYTENDIHCHFHNLLSKQLQDSGFGIYETLDKKLSILLHKEYPTKKKYRRKLLEEHPTGTRGHFDLCLWNPEEVSKRLFQSKNSNEISMEQQTIFAFELFLAEGRGEGSLEHAITHTKWDMLKLKDNEVKHGYILFFARDWEFGEGFLKRIKEQKIPSNTILVYIEKNHSQNFTQRLGSF